MALGTIVRYFEDEDKGYGFIRPDDSSEDVFVHRNQIAGIDNLKPRRGDRVQFEICRGPKGPVAKKAIFLGKNKPIVEPSRFPGKTGTGAGRRKLYYDRHGILILPSDRPLR